ncbi:MAG: MarR family transcriptional regulator [Nitrospinae bacterium]|nr:MarR family transcriptional regulator [Nitrospinota bacterium]
MQPTKESEKVGKLINLIVDRYASIESTLPLLTRELSHSERKVLKLVAGKGKITIGSIGSSLGIPASTTTWLIAGLVKKDILKRHQDQGDKRKSWIELADKGTALARLMERIPDRIAADLLYKLEPAQREDFITLVDKAVGRIEEAGGFK